MRIDIITCLPDLLESPFNHSILKRAQDKKLVEVHIHDLRDYAVNKQRQVDDYQYGKATITRIKVDIETLEKLMDYFGELIIIKNQISQILKERQDK